MISVHPAHTTADASTSSEAVTAGYVETSVGTFGAVFTPRGLAQLTLPPERALSAEEWVGRWMPGSAISGDPAALEPLAGQLNAYLDGELREFSVPLDLRGTPFQLEVWRALLNIGYGETRSYGDIALAIGRPRAVRAVGASNGANPVPIIVPCHRVIGSTGKLTGYGGGLQLKEYLLQLEGAR
jgi:methylated-DNA-[protein]-cysteine S-methyltransferase